MEFLHYIGFDLAGTTEFFGHYYSILVRTTILDILKVFNLPDIVGIGD
jgi:hypothetical protein